MQGYFVNNMRAAPDLEILFDVSSHNNNSYVCVRLVNVQQQRMAYATCQQYSVKSQSFKRTLKR